MVSEAAFQETQEDWYKSDRSQRLGQYLMNILVPTEADPCIFYETNHSEAADKFYYKYVAELL